MAGIFGLFFKDPIEIPAGVARTARQLLSINGKELTNLWQTRSCLLGVCRPMREGLLTTESISTNESLRIHAVHEGNLLNTQEIRHRLEREGHIFTASGDSEVLAHLSEGRRLDWELALRGSFSFAVWDEYEHRLRLAVDRCGAGCLYWVGDKDWLAFATTFQALQGMLLELGKEESGLSLPRSIRKWLDPGGWQVDLQTVKGYIATGCIAAPCSICKSVYTLPPAGRLTWKAGTEPYVEVWWTHRSQPHRRLSIQKAIPEFEQVFQEALPHYFNPANQAALCLSADPASFFLCREIFRLSRAGSGVHAFPSGEDSVLERGMTREWAASFPGEFQEHPVPAPTADETLQVVHEMSEPCGHPSAWNHFTALRTMSGISPSWLDGTGSDEVWSVPSPYRSRWRGGPSPLVLEMKHCCPDLPDCFEEGLLALETETEPFPFPLMKDMGGTDLDRIDSFRMGFSLPFLHLRPLHALASKNSVDIHHLWLDPILLEWMSRLPHGLKTSGRITHWLVRRVLQAGALPIPQSVLTLRKHRSTPPTGRWMSKNLARLFSDTVLDTRAMTAPLFHTPHLRQAFEANRAGVADLGQPLWSLLILELWLREHHLAV